MSDKVIRNPPQPKPQGNLVVVGADHAGDRDPRRVSAKVIVRDDLGQEFYFEVTTHHSTLKPYYR